MNGHAPLFHTTIVHGKLTKKKKKKTAKYNKSSMMCTRFLLTSLFQ